MNSEQNFYNMQCDACSAPVFVTGEQWRNEISVPCPECPDGGVDLVHARRHSDS